MVSSVCSGLEQPEQTWKLSSCYEVAHLISFASVSHQLHTRQQNHRAMAYVVGLGTGGSGETLPWETLT